MTKGFWAGVMLISLLISGASGWYLYTEFQKKSTISVQLNEVPKTPAPIISTETMKGDSLKPWDTSPEKTPAIASSIPNPGAEPEKSMGDHKIKILRSNGTILMEYKDAMAKKVFVLGEFNHWVRKPMKREKDIWSVSLKVKPGSYEFKFVVDGKKMNDPNNPQISKSGNSLLTVKAASK